jgi:hypothetical protein
MMTVLRFLVMEGVVALGILLVIIGLVYLLSALEVIAEVSGDVVWPLLLMGFGVWLIAGRLRGHRRYAWWCGSHRARE